MCDPVTPSETPCDPRVAAVPQADVCDPVTPPYKGRVTHTPAGTVTGSASNDQLVAWRVALARHNAAKRNQRSRRKRQITGVIIKPPPKDAA